MLVKLFRGNFIIKIVKSSYKVRLKKFISKFYNGKISNRVNIINDDGNLVLSKTMAIVQLLHYAQVQRLLYFHINITLLKIIL